MKNISLFIFLEKSTGQKFPCSTLSLFSVEKDCEINNIKKDESSSILSKTDQHKDWD